MAFYNNESIAVLREHDSQGILFFEEGRGERGEGRGERGEGRGRGGEGEGRGEGREEEGERSSPTN